MKRAATRLFPFALSLPLFFGLLAQSSAWRSATPDYNWAFPPDHWAHREYRTEWWYFTGHLLTGDPETPEFAYQFTFFRNGAVSDLPDLDSSWNSGQFIMGHAAVSVPSTKQHLFSEVLYRETPLLGGFHLYPGPRIAWSLGPAGTESSWTLDWNGSAFDIGMKDARQGFGFKLSTMPTKSLVFQGPNGFSKKNPEGTQASLYYSYTRLQTQGTVTLGDQTWAVEGSSWMDKEFGSSMLGEDQPGWDWFALQLEDGRDLMLYRLRDRQGGTSYANATLVETGATAAVSYLGSQWDLAELDWWQSTITGARYPVSWRLRLPALGLDFRIQATFPDQENHSRILPGLDYWEGSVRVQTAAGARIGVGFGELTGYGVNSRPPL